jgi:hypothetical protein
LSDIIILKKSVLQLVISKKEKSKNLKKFILLLHANKLIKKICNVLIIQNDGLIQDGV